jgi:hypothetical protein
MSKKIALAKDIIQVADCHAENVEFHERGRSGQFIGPGR